MMTVIGYKSPGKRYGVLLLDMYGNPLQDRQRCANTIKEGVAIARQDLHDSDSPFATAAVYKVRKNMALAVRFVDTCGRELRPTQDEEV